tara:strand:- start:242 stop:538 length:297 start_codon:yes stop_codon:yes gene_type:complete
MPHKFIYNFHEIDYPEEMNVFINEWLDMYDYNKKATKIEAFVLFKKVIVDLLNTQFKPPSKYKYVKELPEDDRILLVKCLGHNIGVWDLHMYYNIWFL